MWQLQVCIRTFYGLFGFRTVIPRRGESSASSSPNSVPTLSVKRGFVQGSRLGLRVSSAPKKVLGRVCSVRKAGFYRRAALVFGAMHVVRGRRRTSREV